MSCGGRRRNRRAGSTGTDTGLRTRLETAVRRGAPTGNFLWPIDMVSVPGHPSFGYLMPLVIFTALALSNLFSLVLGPRLLPPPPGRDEPRP